MGNKSIFCWDYEKSEQTIYHPPSNLPEIIVSGGFHNFQSYRTLTDKAHHRNSHSIPTYATIMPELESRDINPTTPIYVDTPNDTYVFNNKKMVIYNLNGTYIKAIILSRNCDNDKSTPFYRIQFKNGHFATCTTKFL